MSSGDRTARVLGWVGALLVAGAVGPAAPVVRFELGVPESFAAAPAAAPAAAAAALPVGDPAGVTWGSGPAELEGGGVDAGDPIAVSIPRLGIDHVVVPVGADPVTGQLAVPDDPSTVVWYAAGPVPGRSGSAVIAAHVDWNGRAGPFLALAGAVPGDGVNVRSGDGSTRGFVVIGRRLVSKAALPADVFAVDGTPVLTLVTCGGPFDPVHHRYLDNLVVVAVPRRTE